MIELEIYAAGVRSLDKILELDRALEGIPGIRYKVDSNHDIVYIEADGPTFSVQEIRLAFERLDLLPRIVGAIPRSLESPEKKKTQQLL